MKKKIYIVFGLIILITFFSGITYSFFNSAVAVNTTERGIANFVFQTKELENIDIDLSDIKPGDTKNILFSVTNKEEEKRSDVTIEYILKIKTYHFMPLDINLYKKEKDEFKFVEKCDETYTRNSDNELVCSMPTETLVYTDDKEHEYKLEIIFPSQYNDLVYSNLVDYINLEIDSWQKI